MSEDKFCRVCRCESTPDHPLFHPCKCRGSIKYIHQDCLQFWLQHSNKDTCDICHSKFNFKIIYSDGTPNSIPFKIIIKQFIKNLLRYQYLFVKFTVMAFCLLFEFPFFILLISKLIDFQLGVPIKIESPYLQNIFENYQPTLNGNFNIISFIENICIPGFGLGIVYAIIFISMFMIQNSFIGDEGFQKIVDKKIGRQRHKILDLLQQNRRRSLLRALNQQENSQKIERELEVVGWTENHIFEQGEIQLMINSCRRISLEFILLPDYTEKYQLMQNFIEELNPNEITVEESNQLLNYYKTMRIDHLNSQYDQQERVLFNNIENLNNDFANERREQLDDIAAEFARIVPDNEINANNQAGDVQLPPNPIPRVPQNNNNLRNVRNNNNNNADDEIEQVQGLWDGPKNITFIFQLTSLVNLISMLVLVFFKFIPSFQGLLFWGAFDTLFTSPLKKLFIIIHPYIYPYYKTLKSTSFTQLMCLKYQESIVPKLIVAFFQRNLFIPLKETYINSVEWKPTSNITERVLVVLTGFAVSGFIMFICMKKMERSCTPNNPLSGNYRTIYIIMLQIASVVKVFTLIAIEWILFPLFCGIQIEFALVPIFNDNLYNYKLDPPLVGKDAFGLLWLMGTFFMYFFASFVSMIRANILRSGVLFFIRPSDDPNLQLIHDALMRPFSLRISRIALSASIYSIYILIEFTIVSWGIRLFSPIQVLPFHNNVFFERIGFAYLFILANLLENIFCKYWKNIFYIACSQLRLSSFLLNQDKSNERGKIIYKSFYARVMKKIPDYSEPVLESETNLYFESHPEAVCCFVPDGNYIRAPNDDHVSRNFVRTLFVPVTKSDQLLAPIPEYPNDDEKYNPYGDVDPMDVTTYTIVYKPPHFRWRLFALFAILWAASLIFTFGIYLCNIGMGKTFMKLTDLETYLGVSKEYYKIDIYSMTLTIFVLSQLEIVSKSIEEQWKVMTSAVNGDTEKFNAIKVITINTFNKLKQRYVRILESAIVKMVFSMICKQFVVTVALCLCGYPILGSLIKEGVTPIWGIPFFVSFITFTISLRDSNRNRFKIYLYTTLFIIGIKIILTFTVLDYARRVSFVVVNDEYPDGKVFYKTEQTSDYVLIFEFLTKFLPESAHTLLPLLLVDNFVGIEAFAYHIIWGLSGMYVTFVYIFNAWSNFMDKTRQIYFDNTKVLSNADDEEAEENTLDVDNNTDINIVDEVQEEEEE